MARYARKNIRLHLFNFFPTLRMAFQLGINESAKSLAVGRGSNQENVLSVMKCEREVLLVRF